MRTTKTQHQQKRQESTSPRMKEGYGLLGDEERETHTRYFWELKKETMVTSKVRGGVGKFAGEIENK